MKIVNMKTFIVQAYKDNWVLVKLYTDEGITGLGECSLEGREHTVVAAVNALFDYLKGKNPFEIEKHHYRMYRNAYWGAGPMLCGALSAIDGALWDIKGKALGVPVYELLGGAMRECVPVYANRWFFGADTPAKLADKAKNVAAQGYSALKWDPFGCAERDIKPAELRRAMEEIEAVYDAVNGRAQLIIEGHGRFNVTAALTVARHLERFEPMFFEEPVMPENMDALAEVRAKSPVPIAAGERFYSLFDFRAAFENRCIDYAQPDLRVTGGLTEGKKIAAMAEGHMINICPHNIHGQVGTAMSLHLLASIPNAGVLEHSTEEIPWKSEIFNTAWTVENGCMTIPGSPGLGLELNEDACLQHPHKSMSMIELMFDDNRI